MLYQTLITSQQLAEIIDHENCIVFDCRFHLADVEWGRNAYVESHIPGAIYAHLDDDLCSPITLDSGRHPLPDMQQLVQWLGQNGMSEHKQVVVYDDTGGTQAARLWWLLRGLGHESVALLDGGLQAWLDQGFAVTAEIDQPHAENYQAEFDWKLVVETQTVFNNVDKPSFLLVDVRAEERYQGINEPIDPIAGHIPGAENLPLTENLDARGFFKPAEQLRELYAPLDARCIANKQVYMCGSGVTACHSLLAVVIAGLPMPRLYNGSWSEWIRDANRPIATS
jgi:thiosulfate/3-mercaptopyruvate sulfurtransferase